jgi:protein TonB
MKMKYILPSLFVSLILLVACSDEPTGKTPVTLAPDVEVAELDYLNEDPDSLLDIDSIPEKTKILPPPPPEPPQLHGGYEGMVDLLDDEPTLNIEPMDIPPRIPDEYRARVSEEIIDFPEVQASYPGGSAALKKFIAENINYPKIDKEAGIEGKVYASFVVEIDGSITNVKIQRGVSKTIDNEAKRVIRLTSNWNPAEIRGRAVRCSVRLPITFEL